MRAYNNTNNIYNKNNKLNENDNNKHYTNIIINNKIKIIKLYIHIN